jgi:type I restriction enzyme S subunit
MKDLPSGWTCVPLKELVEATRPRISPREADGLPFIGMDHIESQTMRLLGTVPASTMKSAGVRFEPGDVLYGRLRPYLNKVYRPDFNGLGSAEFIVLTPSARLDGEYLSYLLNSADFVRFASGVNTGDRPRVDFKQIGTYLVPLPELEEQRQIVEAIDVQVSRIDAAVAGLRRAQHGLQQFVAAALQAAYEQRLNPPEDRRGGRWPPVPLESLLAEPLRNGHSAKRTPTGRVRTLTLTAVTRSDFSEANTKLTDADAGRVADLWLRPGDILIERSNTPDLVGTASMYRGPENFAIFPDLMIRARLSPSASPDFVELIIRAPSSRRYFRSKAQGIAGTMPKIDQQTVANLPIPLPPREIQDATVRTWQEISSSTKRLETELSRGLRRAMNLREQVYRSAFRGEFA